MKREPCDADRAFLDGATANERQTVYPFYDLTVPLLESCLFRALYHLSAICQESFAVDHFPNEIELHFFQPKETVS